MFWPRRTLWMERLTHFSEKNFDVVVNVVLPILFHVVFPIFPIFWRGCHNSTRLRKRHRPWVFFLFSEVAELELLEVGHRFPLHPEDRDLLVLLEQIFFSELLNFSKLKRNWILLSIRLKTVELPTYTVFILIVGNLCIHI